MTPPKAVRIGTSKLAAFGLFIIFVATFSVVAWQASIHQFHSQTINLRSLGAEQGGSKSTGAESADDRIADYNFWLDIFTLLLALVSGLQFLFLIRADQNAGIAANAAKQSADAAVRKDIPWIIARTPSLDGLDIYIPEEGPYASHAVTDRFPGLFTSVPYVTFVNIGNTAARISGILAGWKVAKVLPETPEYFSSTSMTETHILPGKDWPVELKRATIVIRENERFDLADGKTTIWFYVRLIYSDFMGDIHHSNFVWKWACPDGVGDYYFVPDAYAPPAYREKT